MAVTIKLPTNKAGKVLINNQGEVISSIYYNDGLFDTLTAIAMHAASYRTVTQESNLMKVSRKTY